MTTTTEPRGLPHARAVAAPAGAASPTRSDRLRRMLVFLVLFCGTVVLGPIGWHRWGPRIGFNYTESEPIGFYLLKPFTRPVRGERVVLPVPARVRDLVYGRRWLQKGDPLIKAIGALPGERYCVTNRGLYIDGHRRGPVFTVDDQGLPLPKLRGCFTVRRGQFLPLGTHSPKSFDGRYFGTVPLTLIRYRAVPLWTF